MLLVFGRDGFNGLRPGLFFRKRLLQAAEAATRLPLNLVQLGVWGVVVGEPNPSDNSNFGGFYAFKRRVNKENPASHKV